MSVYGIDFGTRNTAVECAVGRLYERSKTIPSAMAYHKLSRQTCHGAEALAILEDPQKFVDWEVATSFKSRLATQNQSVVDAPNGSRSAEDVTADYLKALVQRAERAELPPLRRAMFSIPVGFPAEARQGLLAAAGKAGIEVLGLISESTAAYVSATAELGGAGLVAVVDWGAGTLDISVLRVSGGGGVAHQFDEQACRGSARAGDHIDRAVYDCLAAQVARQDRVLPAIDDVPATRRRAILRICEQEKIALSSGHASVQPVFPIFSDGRSATGLLSSEELRSITRPFVNEVFVTIDRALADAGLSAEQLDQVVFVGGAISLLGFRSEAIERFGPRAVFPQQPEWAVASGAFQVAQAAEQGAGQFYSLQDCGIVLDDGRFLLVTRIGDPFIDHKQDVTVAATDASLHASIVCASRDAGAIRYETSLTVPLQGHPGEPVLVQTTLRKDLCVQVDACSLCGIEEDRRTAIISNTRFRFRT